MIPYFKLGSKSTSIKLFGKQKFAFFCLKIFQKFINESCWLNTGYLTIRLK